MDFAVLAKLAIVAIFPNVVTAGGPLEVGGNPVRICAGNPGKAILVKSECDVCARDPDCRLRMARWRLCVDGGPRGCAEDHILPACLLVNCWHTL